MERIKLSINGQPFSEYTSINLSESIDTICANLSLEGMGALELPNEAEVRLELDGVLRFVGEVDGLHARYSTAGVERSLSARSFASRIVDSQISLDESNIALRRLLRKVCAKFDVPMQYSDNTLHTLEKVACRCEGALDLISREAKKANLRLRPSLDGGFQVFKIGKDQILPVAISTQPLQIEVAHKLSGYSLFRVVGEQAVSTRPDSRFSKREYELLQSDLTSLEDCKNRADLAYHKQSEQLYQVQLTLPRWSLGGEFLRVGQVLHLDLSRAGVRGDFVINSLQASLGLSGTVPEYSTSLTLFPHAIYA